MRKFTFTEMNCYLTLFNKDRVIVEYNNIVDNSNHDNYRIGETDHIYMVKNFDDDMKDRTPSEIAYLTCGGYFTMHSPYYMIDFHGNAVSIDVDNILYTIGRRLTLGEMFTLCQRFGIEQDLQ